MKGRVVVSFSGVDELTGQLEPHDDDDLLLQIYDGFSTSLSSSSTPTGWWRLQLVAGGFRDPTVSRADRSQSEANRSGFDDVLELIYLVSSAGEAKNGEPRRGQTKRGAQMLLMGFVEIRDKRCVIDEIRADVGSLNRPLPVVGLLSFSTARGECWVQLLGSSMLLDERIGATGSGADGPAGSRRRRRWRRMLSYARWVSGLMLREYDDGRTLLVDGSRRCWTLLVGCDK
ncbi:hypothetical protein ACLOJK_022663 [Asimina triloba]